MAYEYESKEVRALKSIDSTKSPSTNKDFVKNMRTLNRSVDYISSYMVVMQKGIDDANKNVIEQLQGFVNDLIVLFAGGEPTGIELGDLKYIIQALGALFGLNGPFPLSLLEAAQKFLLGYVVPLPQFTDVIFDSIEAWAEQFGLDASFIDGLRDMVDDFQDFQDSFNSGMGTPQLIIDNILSSLTKQPVVNGKPEDLFDIFKKIPADSITGALGFPNVGGDLAGIIDSFVSGSVGKPGATGASPAEMAQTAEWVSSGSAQGRFAWELLNQLNTTPVARGLLPAGRANYDISSANTYLPSTAAAPLSVSFGMTQAMPIGVVQIYGYATPGITAFNVNIRKVNIDSGARDLVYHSPNMLGSLVSGSAAAAANWMMFDIPAAQKIPAKATDRFWVEFVPVGTGTVYIRGMSSADTIKDHPLSPIPCFGTVVVYADPNNPAPTLPKPTSGPNIPWVEFAPDRGPVADHHEPEIFTFVAPGTSVPIPSWCNRLDAIPLGRGGSGHDGATLGIAGEAGLPGKFAPVTWERGKDFAGNAVLVQFDELSDGSAKISIPGKNTVGAAGQNGQSTKFGISPVGQGPKILQYNGQNYQGGGDQSVPGSPGVAPGGAGNGGNGIFFQKGGAGARSAAWLCFRQVAVDGEVSSDTTPPTPPTNITLRSKNNSSLTLSWTGATDA